MDGVAGPVGFAYIMTDDKITELARVRHRDFYRDLNLMIDAEKRTAGIVEGEVGGKWVGIGLRNGCGVMGAHVMGCEIVFPDEVEPWAMPFLKDIEDVESLEVPEPNRNPAVRYYLDRAREFEGLTGIKSGVGFEGPISVSALCRGTTQYYADVLRAPELCRKLADLVTDTCLEWERYHDEQMGIEPGEGVGLGDDCASWLSPRAYEHIAFPPLLKIIEAHPKAKHRSMHNCGQTNHLLAKISELRLSSFELGEMVDVARVRELMPDTHIGRLLDYKILSTNDEEEVTKYVKEQLFVAAVLGNISLHVEAWRPVSLETVRLVKVLVDEHNGNRH
jgi:uroporphyrinogen-III decarboxylase